MTQNPNWTRPFILVLILCGLGTLAWWLEFQHKPQEQAQEESAKRPFALPKDVAITRLTVESGGKSFAWKCADGGGQACKPGNNSKWEFEAPLKTRADDNNLNSLVSAIDRLQATDTLDFKDETLEKRATILKEYGLSPESLQGPSVRRVTIETAKDGIWVGYFGNTHPVNDGIFTVVEHEPAGQKVTGKADETKVFVSPPFFKANFEHDLTYWRDKKLFALNATEIDGFKLEGKLGGGAPGAKPTWIEGTKKDGNWTLKTPEGEFPGDIESIDSMLSGASFLTAKDIVAENKDSPDAAKALKGTHPLLTLTLHKKAVNPKSSSPNDLNNSIVLAVSEQAGAKPSDKRGGTGIVLTHLYAKISSADPLYELQNGARNQLGKTLKDLRLNKLITSVDRFGAKKLEFSGAPLGASPLTLTNENGKWTLGGGAKATGVQDKRVQDTLDKLSGNRIQDYLSTAAATPAEANGLKMTLWTDTAPNAAPKRQLVFWKSGGKLFARDLLSARKAAFQVDTAVEGGLPWDRAFYTAMPAQKNRPASKTK